MRLALATLAALGCTTHHRITSGVTTHNSNSGAGGEVTAEGSIGAMFHAVAGSTVRAGHGSSGLSMRFGLGIEHGPRIESPWGGRATMTLGASLTDTDPDGDLRREFRGSLAMVRGLLGKLDSEAEGRETESFMTLGLELFVNVLGGSETEYILGLGVTAGWYKNVRDLGLLK